MPNQKKIEIAKDLKEEFASSRDFFFLDYLGADVSKISELRKSLRKTGAFLRIAKNTLIERAAGIKNEGPTAVLFARGEGLSPLKMLVEFSKKNNLLTIKKGFLEGRQYNGEELTTIAGLPAREVLLSKLTLILKSPIYRLSNLLSGNQRNLVIVLNRIARTDRAPEPPLPG